MTPIRVVLVDDQVPFRRSLAKLLAKFPTDVAVVGQAANATDAVQLATEVQPDVVLMDVEMPGVNGILATADVRAVCPDCNVILLTTFDKNEYVFGGLQAGAASFVLKDIGPDELIETIHAAAHGQASFQPTIATKLVTELKRLRSVPEVSPPRTDVLSQRECELMQLVAQGMSNREIAELRTFSEGTVKQYLSTILKKLEARDRAHAVSRAKDLGLI